MLILASFSISGDWLWQLMLRTPTSLHLHSVPVLSSPRGHFGSPIRHAHGHVESWVHPSRALDRISASSWRRRGRSIVMHHWASWNAASKIIGPKQKGQKLYQLKRQVLPSIDADGLILIGLILIGLLTLDMSGKVSFGNF